MQIKNAAAHKAVTCKIDMICCLWRAGNNLSSWDDTFSVFISHPLREAQMALAFP